MIPERYAEKLLFDQMFWHIFQSRNGAILMLQNFLQDIINKNVLLWQHISLPIEHYEYRKHMITFSQ